MTPRVSGHFSIFGLAFFVLNSLLGIARQWSREKFAILSQSLGMMLEFWYIKYGLAITKQVPEALIELSASDWPGDIFWPIRIK